MEKKILVVGKDILGETGFCMVPRKMTDEDGKDLFDSQLETIKSAIWNGRPIVCTSMTSINDLIELDYNYIPTIAFADEELHNPENIYFKVKCMNNRFVPYADFIVWDKSNSINVMTYSKTAPVLYFETQDGMCCLGTILRKSLMLHGEYFIKTLIHHMHVSEENPICASIISCTNSFYTDINMKLNEYVKNMLSAIPEISNVMDIGLSPETDPDICYKADDSGNHVIVLY